MSISLPPSAGSAGSHRLADGPAADPQAISKHVETALTPFIERLEALLSYLGEAKLPLPHLTVTDFAKQVGRSEYRVRAWIKEKRIRAIKTAGAGPRSRWLIPRSELLRLLGNEAVTG